MASDVIVTVEMLILPDSSGENGLVNGLNCLGPRTVYVRHCSELFGRTHFINCIVQIVLLNPLRCLCCSK